MIGSLSTFQQLAIVNKDNSNMSDSDIIRRIFWSIVIYIFDFLTDITAANILNLMLQEGKSLSIHEGNMQSYFLISVN